MKHSLLFLAIFVFGAIDLIAQSPTPAPTPQPSNTRTPNDPRTGIPSMRDSNEAFDRLRQLEIRTTEESSKRSLFEIEEAIYRKPSKKETEILNPSRYLLEKYAGFLDQADTGIVKLNADSDCGSDANIIAAKENCLQYSFPGAGTAFSFRTKSYRIPRLADLILSNDVLKTDGVLQQGLMVNLAPGVSVEDVTLNTQGIKYLADFKPAQSIDELKKNDAALAAGIKADGFLYRLGFYAKEQAVFALRSIAYRGKLTRSFKGTSYNELNFDKRGDVIVVFQVVEKDAAGNVTIIWKKLSQRDSPVMKIKDAKEKINNER